MNSTRYENLEPVEVFADVFIRVPDKLDVETEGKEERKIVDSFDGWRPTQDNKDN